MLPAARIQSAVDACPTDGCRIELSDAEYRIDHQIWIVGKKGVQIVGTRSDGTRPRIAWEDSLVEKVANPFTASTLEPLVARLFTLRPPPGPGRPDVPSGWLMWPRVFKDPLAPRGTASDAADTLSNVGFQNNAMLHVERSDLFELHGIELDGLVPAYFVTRASTPGAMI